MVQHQCILTVACRPDSEAFLPTGERITVEICVDSLDSALAAVRGGADRLELCGNLGLGGGTTPSLGLFNAIHRALRRIVPIMVMIRPRTGDFCYTHREFEVMLEDIRIFKNAGAAGVVLGVLNKDGKVVKSRLQRLAAEAAPLEVCFHRAFDMTDVGHEALIAVYCIPHITRILTSGHRGPKVDSPAGSHAYLDGMFTAARTIAPGFPTILPGSGINPTTLPQLRPFVSLGMREIHLSASTWVPGEMVYRKEGMGMGVGGDGEWGIWSVREETVREVRRIVDSWTIEAS